MEKRPFLDIFKEKMLGHREAKEQGQESERGKNTHVEMFVGRHGKPLKDPETNRSLDKITEQGLLEARQLGQEEKSPRVMITGSEEVERARETGGAYREGLDENLVEVVNRHGEKGKGSKFGVYAMSESDPWTNPNAVINPMLMEAKKMVADGQLDASQIENYAFKKFLIETSAEELKKAGAATREEIGALLAFRISAGEKMSAKLFKDLDLKVMNFTHGPNTDAFLLEMGLDEALKDENGEYKFMTPGENYSIDFDRDDKGELKTPILRFRGKTFNLDVERLHSLSEQGKKILEERLKKKKGK